MTVHMSRRATGASRWSGEASPASGLSVAIVGSRHGRIAECIAEALRCRGHDVQAAGDDAGGREVVLAVATGTARLTELCRAAALPRGERAVVAVGEGGVEECIAALEAGADDYLRHPFAVTELESRMRALVRRRRRQVPERLLLGDLVLEPEAMAVSRGGTPIDLTAGEFRVMEMLLRARGRVVGREELHGAMGSVRRSLLASRTVDVCIHALRDKLDRPFGTISIDTVRGVGYRLHAAYARAPQ